MAELQNMVLSWGEVQVAAKNRKIVEDLCPTGDKEVQEEEESVIFVEEIFRWKTLDRTEECYLHFNILTNLELVSNN